MSKPEQHVGGREQRGFTLIEALTVVSVLAVVLSLAMPNLRSFVVGTKVSSLSNEFNAALMQTRALAVSRNSCASLCASSDVSPENGTGTCTAGAAADYQKGWIVFENTACNEAAVNPATAGRVTALRQGDAPEYRITASAAGLNNVMFDPRGFANLTSGGSFTVTPPTGSDARYRRVVCVDMMGRSSVRKDLGNGTCS